MILPAHPDASARWLRLQGQLAQTEDPDERDAILEEMDEIEYGVGEAYIVPLRGDSDGPRVVE